jgi:hypothetical protein
MSEYVNCANCGKQNMVLEDDPCNVLCEFCGLPVRIKQVNKKAVIKPLVTNHANPLVAAQAKEPKQPAVPSTPTPLTQAPIAPPIASPDGKKHYNKVEDRMAYLELHRAEVISDYHKLSWKDWLWKWRMYNRLASKVVKAWGLKHKPHRAISKKQSKQGPPQGVAPRQVKPHNFKFPPMPDSLPLFNEAWPVEVKIGYFHARAIIAVEEILKMIINRPGEKTDAKKS